MTKRQRRKADQPRTRRHERDKAKVTINDIARLANVSKKTVSRVINDSPLVRERNAREGQAGHRRAWLRSRSAGARARVSPLVLDRDDLRQPEPAIRRQHAARDTRHARGHELPADRAARATAAIRASTRACGRSSSSRSCSARSCRRRCPRTKSSPTFLTAAGCPYVRIASVLLDAPHSMIKTHDSEGAAAAARHIATLGHERIAHIRGPSTFRSSHERLRGLRGGARGVRP